MKKQKHLDHVSLQDAIKQSEDEIKKCQIVIGLSKIGLKAFKKELENYPPPTKKELVKAGGIEYAG